MIDWYGTGIARNELESLVGFRPGRHAYKRKGVQRGQKPLVEIFQDYLRAKLTVRPGDPARLRAWLRGCRYVRDIVRHKAMDLWLHPEDFEQLREGDCEDHALWAWVQLLRMGVLARFTVGRRTSGHAWVTLYGSEGILIFETTRKEPGYVPAPWDGNPEYLPRWSVDGAGDFFWHDPQRGF